MTYIYPVVSRRAGGVSVGINLNPNNACNWRCIYCQVPQLKRGTAPAIDLIKLEAELRAFLLEILHSDFMHAQVAPEARRINDIALSGNGEPTSAREFEQVIELIGNVKADYDLPIELKLVLITNGSLIDRPGVQSGLRRMSELNGEVWFKLDSVTREGRQLINSTTNELEADAGKPAVGRIAMPYLAANLCISNRRSAACSGGVRRLSEIFRGIFAGRRAP